MNGPVHYREAKRLQVTADHLADFLTSPRNADRLDGSERDLISQVIHILEEFAGGTR